jgi:CDP-diacylglycerol--glycerol-3-phosphate 3-phosphatidyltransferase
MKINLPNQITIARLVMAIVFFACLAQYRAYDPQPRNWLLDVSAILFIVAAASDALDGYLARKHNQVTAFGRITDPFVDKILTIGAYTFLAGTSFSVAGESVSDVASWMVVLILGRELLVTSLRGVTEAAGTSFGANLYGKAKMVLQSITVVWILLSIAHPDAAPWAVTVRPWLVYLTITVTVASGIPYVWAAKHAISQNPEPAS